MANELIDYDQVTDISLDPDVMQRASAIEQVTAQLAAAEEMGQVAYGITSAKARRALKVLMNENIMQAFRELMGEEYRVDVPQKYSQDDVLRPLIIQALVCQASITGNEFNLLGGRVYLTKEYYERKLFESGIEYTANIGDDTEEKGRPDRRYFDAHAHYTYQGKSGELGFHKQGDFDYRIVTVYNKTDKPDTLRGKAESKLMRRLYKHCTGRSVAFTEDTEDGAIVEPAQPAKVIEDGPPSIYEQYQHQIADCHDDSDVEVMKELIVNSRQLSDDERSDLAELLATKSKRIAARTKEAAKD